MENQQLIDFSNKNIVLIEDEVEINELYKHVLTQAGLKVVTAFDGESGLGLINQTTNLVLLDIMLPKKNGMAVLHELKQNEVTKTIPVILLTNLGQSDVIHAAFTMGAQGYFLKMRLKPTELVEVVKTFLANPQYRMDFNKLDLD